MSVKMRLGIMMFLQYAIWGAWSPVLSAYLEKTLHFNGIQIGVIYSLLPLATIIAPFIGGQFADRYFSSEKLIAILQLIGGALLIYISRLTDYSVMMWLFFLYSLLYAPTMALTNSIAFINMKNSEKEFGQVRVWGTIGWIFAGLLLSGWRYLGSAPGADTLLLAGIFSLIMGVQSFTLPHTPPQKNAAKPWAFLEALKMLKDRNVLIFTIIAFVVATELMFYYVLTAPFLESPVIGVAKQNTPMVMVIAQAAEILVLAFMLPWALPKYGIRTVLTIGILAWPLRYIIFAIGSPSWLVIASLALHGFCFVFFFAAAFIYFDTIAPSDIRNSAQSFITLVTYGLGNYVGSLFAGWIKSLFTSPEGLTNWTHVFLVPCALTILCAIAFLAFFKVDSRKQKTQAIEA